MKLTELSTGGNMQYLAIDLGSSSARVMLCNGANNLQSEEIARFAHTALQDKNGHLRWNIDELFTNLKNVVEDTIKKYNIASIGICSWGVDYGVIGENNKLIDMPYCYRDSRGEQMFNKFHTSFSKQDLFEESGIYPNPINTVYQLLADKDEQRYAKKQVKIAMIADLFAFYLTGNIRIERTNASTTGLLDLTGNDWNYPLIDKLGLDRDIFPKLIFDGEVYGDFLGVKVVAVGSHDTASAIYALENLDDSSAFLATGSWLLIGKVIDNPISTKTAFDSAYTNERINGGKVSLLDNINGLFIIQKLVAENNLDYKEIDLQMQQAKVLGELNVDNLMSPENMTIAMQNQLGLTQCDIYDLVKTAYYSLAKRVAVSVEKLESITNSQINTIVMTGGGTKAQYFVETLKDLLNKEIICEKSEGATRGNALRQSEIK